MLNITGYMSGNPVAASGITYLGAVSTDGAGSATLNLDLTPLSLQQDDIVVLYTAIISNGETSALGAGINTGSTGWTEQTEQFANDNREISATMAHKIMGATPDTSVTVDGSTNSVYPTIVVARAYRGVDTGSPFDGSILFMTQNNSGAARTDDITPTQTGAVVVNMICVSDASPVSDATGAPSGWGNFDTESRNGSGTPGGQICSADIAWSSGTISADNYSGTFGGATDSRCGATFALNPA